MNWNTSPYGSGWWLSGLDYLLIDGSGDVTLVKSDGTMGCFTSLGGGNYASPAGPFASDTLSSYSSSNTYVLTGTDGTAETFNSYGQLTSLTDNDGNVTQYGYAGPTGPLTSIVYPDNETTTFAPSSNLLTITDFVSNSNPVVTLQTTWLTINNSGQLTEVQQADPATGTQDSHSPTTNFIYNSTTGPLESMTDADGNTTTYTYRADGTLQTVTQADGSTLGYQSARSQLFGPAGDNDPGSGPTNLAYLVPAASARAVAYDESQNPTAYTFDSFGDVTSTEDPLGNVSVNTCDANGLVTASLGPYPDTAGTRSLMTTATITAIFRRTMCS